MSAYAETRIIRTYQPAMMYNHHANPFMIPCPSCRNTYYNGANYYPSYTRTYYGGYNSNYFNNRYYPPVYNNQVYEGNSRNDFGTFDKIRAINRTMYRDISTPYSPRVYRLNRSDISNNVKPVSYKYSDKAQSSDISRVEKYIYGKSFEHQEMDLRLNRLEKSVFKQTYPTLNTEDRIENILINYNKEAGIVSLDDLARLEKSVFKKTYDNENELSRLSRLEVSLLGAVQQGKPNKRLQTLENAVAASKYTSPYGTCYGGYIPPINDNRGIRNTLSKLGIFLGNGYPTGWSPQIPPYEEYGLQDNSNSSSYVGNRGYYYNNVQRGTGSSIQILD